MAKWERGCPHPRERRWVFFEQFADVGIRAPEQNGLLQQALASGCLPDIAVDKLPGIKTAGPKGHSADDHANGRAPGVA